MVALRPTGLCRRTAHKGPSMQHQDAALHLHSRPRLHGGPSDSGAQSQLCWPSHRVVANRPASAAGSTADVQSIRRQHAPPAAQANRPMAAQFVPALCVSSSRLCCSCSHTRPCIWRPILVHELCHTAALRRSYESPSLLLSA
jgi:hypothetical protein